MPSSSPLCHGLACVLHQHQVGAAGGGDLPLQGHGTVAEGGSREERQHRAAAPQPRRHRPRPLHQQVEPLRRHAVHHRHQQAQPPHTGDLDELHQRGDGVHRVCHQAPRVTQVAGGLEVLVQGPHRGHGERPPGARCAGRVAQDRSQQRVVAEVGEGDSPQRPDRETLKEQQPEVAQDTGAGAEQRSQPRGVAIAAAAIKRNQQWCQTCHAEQRAAERKQVVRQCQGQEQCRADRQWHAARAHRGQL